MDNRYEEQVMRMGFHEIGKYFEDMVTKKRLDRKVAVLVEDYMTSLFFVPCDKLGFPNRYYFEYLNFSDFPVNMWEEDSLPSATLNVTKRSIEVSRPMIMHRIPQPDWREETMIFLWEGRVVSTKEIPLEELEVKKLMVLAQEAVKKREGLIIDEAFKNRQIK